MRNSDWKTPCAAPGALETVPDTVSPNDSENGNWNYSLYDGVNRLKTATNSTTGQTFTYNFDAWGNMTCSYSQGPGTCLALTYDTVNMTNRILDGIHQYDNNVPAGPGNMTADGTHGYVYDAENRITCVLGTDGTCTSASAMLYFYDAQGQRVGKQQANTLEDYVYDPQGNIISVHDGSTNPLRTDLYAGSRHVATWAPNPNGQYWDPYPSGLFYNHTDWLGTERVRTNSGGVAVETCTDTPYGMNLNCITQADISPMHFTGKQRDYESNLDYFGARYFGGGNSLGRFMTPDAFFKDSHVGDPQSWNEYAYARNNPLRYVDPNGENATVTTNCTTTDNQTTCNVNISASIAIYAGSGSNLTQDQLNHAATAIQNSIQNAWTGSFTQDGVTYNVSTQVTVSVAASQDAAMSSGAQNVIGMVNGPPGKGEDADTRDRPLLGGPDTGKMDINHAGGDSPHEFTHLLGVDDHAGQVLSNTDGRQQPEPLKATERDFQWGIKEVTTRVSNMKNAGNLPSNYHNQTTIRAPRFWWNWK